MDMKSINMIGLISVGIYFIFGVAAITMAGINFSIMHIKWGEGPTKHLAPLELAVTIYLLVCSFFGFFTFSICSTKKCFVFIYLFIMLLSFLFSWAIGIFASIGGTVWYKKNYNLGCDTELTGVLEMWQNVDDYLMYADSLFCSPMCPCQIELKLFNKFQNEFLIQDFTNDWETTDSGISSATGIITNPFNFKNCTHAVRNEALKRYMETGNATFRYLQPEKFANYWGTLERRFNCTGWCKTNYINPYTYKRTAMIKFLFSDVNSGIPKYIGCLHEIVNWLPSLIGAIGGCLIVSAFLQTISWFLALSLIGKGEENMKVNPESA